MRKVRFVGRCLFLPLFMFLAFPLRMVPGFIMKITHGNVVLAGNNEDINNPLSKIWFEPPEKGKHGITYFGDGSNYPQGGMNDQGLFFDGVAGYPSDWVLSLRRPDDGGILFRKIMEECAAVEEAVAVFDQYKFSAFLADELKLASAIFFLGPISCVRPKRNRLRITPLRCALMRG